MTTEKLNTRDSEINRKRYLSIDVFKGLSVVLMVFANAVAIYENVPAWSKHAVDYGLTYVDIVAPFFVFMLALNFNVSYAKRLKAYGRKKTYLRFIRRYIIFIILGFFLTLGYESGRIYLQWGTFQVLGLSGLMLLPLIELKSYIRLLIAIILMIIHQIILLTSLQILIYDAIEGGLFGALSWGSMMILSSVLADGLKKNKIDAYFLVGGIFCSVLGIITSFFWKISRAYISLPYILICVGIGSLVYYFLYNIFEKWGASFKFSQRDNIFSLIGRNAFFLYLIDVLITYPIYMILPSDISWLFILTIGFLFILFIGIIAYFMNKVEMYIII